MIALAGFQERQREFQHMPVELHQPGIIARHPDSEFRGFTDLQISAGWTIQCLEDCHGIRRGTKHCRRPGRSRGDWHRRNLGGFRACKPGGGSGA